MRKITVLTLVILIMLPVLPAQAQDDDYVACTVEEFVGGGDIIAQAFEEITSLMETSDNPDASELTAATLLIDSYALGYWEGFSEASEEGLCAEVDWLGYTGGLVLDEMLITSQLSALALHESDTGNDEVAEIFAELAVARAETLEVSVEGISLILEALGNGEMTLGFELAECSDEELEATSEGLSEIYTVYEELAELAEEAEYSETIIAFATLSKGYWEEFMPEVPACYEAQDQAIYAGLIIDESLIIASGYYLAELESNEEVAVALEENAGERYSNLEEALAEYEEEE